jgi:hypothetical protein
MREYAGDIDKVALFNSRFAQSKLKRGKFVLVLSYSLGEKYFFWYELHLFYRCYNDTMFFPGLNYNVNPAVFARLGFK